MTNLNVQKVSKSDDRTLPVFAEFDALADHIRKRAFSLFDSRGRRDGYAMDDWLRAEREASCPMATLSESEREYQLEVALAGFEPGDIDITATPSELIVKANHESKSKKKEKREGTKIRWSEFRRENVYRHIDLPESVDVDRVSAKFHNGLLKITAPKIGETKKTSRRTSISSAA